MLPDFWKSFLEVSQASLICPSSKSNMKMKVSVILTAENQ